MTGVRVALTLLVRDAIDVIEPMLSFHLAAGVDHVVVTDHASTDGTTDVLRRFERDGVLSWTACADTPQDQGRLTTAMARSACVDHGATWVIPADVDEWWWSREGPLPEVLAAIPSRYALVHGVWRHFVLRPEDGRDVHERMTIRRRSVRDRTSLYQRQVKVAFRASPHVRVQSGNHALERSRPGATLRGWYPFEVLHFPVRNAAQLAEKVHGRLHPVSRHHRAALDHPGGPGRLAAELCLDDDAAAAGLAAGALVEDVRLRDALRSIRRGERLVTGPPTLAEDADFARDLELIVERDSALRLRPRLDRLAGSLAARGDRARISAPRA